MLHVYPRPDVHASIVPIARHWCRSSWHCQILQKPGKLGEQIFSASAAHVMTEACPSWNFILELTACTSEPNHCMLSWVDISLDGRNLATRSLLN